MNKVREIKVAISGGLLDSAIAQATAAMQQCEPGDSQQYRDLHYLQVVALRLNKQFDRAMDSAHRLIAIEPEYGRVWQEQGYLYKALNQPEKAALAFYKAVQFNPALLTSWHELKPWYQRSGNQEALSLANSQIAWLSALPREILGARDLMYEGEHLQADQVCRRFLQQHKHHGEALFLLAEIGIALSVYGEAEFLLQSCLELHPNHISAGIAYLKLLTKMGKFEQAKALADKILTAEPEHIPVQLARATAMVGIGELPDAIAVYHALLKQQPDQPAIQLLLGHAQKAAGRYGEAITAYKTAGKLKPEFGDAWWSLANTKTYGFDDVELAHMKQMLDSGGMLQEDKIHMLFALGKAFEDRQDFAQSYQFYQRGNALKQKIVKYSPEFIEQQVEAQIQQCTSALFESRKGVGSERQDPIFIVGLPRSGSTLLEQILASHSQVDGTMELHNILALVSRLRGQNNRYPAILNQLDSEYFQRFGEQYLTETQVYRHNAPFFIDKMPNNFVHIGLIKLILPNAKIIDARRDQMACTFSCFKQLFGEGQEFTYSQESLGRYYQAYLKMMAHWDKVLPGAVLKVQHEDVVNDLETQVRRMLDYCELPFEDACVDFHKTQRTIKTPSSEQVRQPIYRSGLEQWRNFESHLSQLKQALVN